MAIYRQIQTTFWGDSFITTLTPEQKYFYIYLLTNDNTKQCGIYEITPRKMSFDTGYNQETIEKLLAIFEKYKKIKWSKTTNEIALINWPKYNNHGSPKVQSCIKKELTCVKNKTLIPYIYGIDTISQQQEEQKQQEEQEQSISESDSGFYDLGLPTEDKPKKPSYAPEVDIIYSKYPSECYVKSSSTGKTLKNKEKIRSIIKEKGFDWLRDRVENYLVNCKLNKTYLKNFGTFLNNIPEPVQTKASPVKNYKISM